MATKKEVIDRANELGVEVDHEDMFGTWATILYAPEDGSYFGASCSTQCAIRQNKGPWGKSTHWDAVLEDMNTLEI